MSKPTINLFFLVPMVPRGGATSYTVHLARAFHAMGYGVRIMRVGSRTLGARDFAYGLKYYRVCPDDARMYARLSPSLIAYCFWRKQSAYAMPLLALGIPMVLHDPAEFHADEMAFLRCHGNAPLVIRERNVAGLREYGISARYCPHPYCPSAASLGEGSRLHAVSLARVDFRKRTHLLIEANETLAAEGRAIHLYGEVSRVYEFHKLGKEHPHWRRWYHGSFPMRWGVAVRLFQRARFAVDMTAIKNDGGGTQYTFFEAWEAGLPLVLNAAWKQGCDDEVRDGDSCIMVRDAPQLVDALRQEPRVFGALVAGGRRITQAHLPAQVVPAYLAAMGA